MNRRLPRTAKWIDELGSSFWFVPGVLMLLGAGLAALAVQGDQQNWLSADLFPSWIRLGNAEAARTVLTTVAGSTITIVSLAFSITIVALTLASSQFGSRLLYSFMRDRSTQVVLGVLLGTFVYCLVALSTVRSSDAFLVPQLATTLGIVLGLSNVVVLIYFLHDAAESMQASAVIARVRRDLSAVMRRMLPKRGEEAAEAWEDPPQGPGIALHAVSSGVLQGLDEEALVGAARRADVTLVMERRPGDHLIEGMVIARAHTEESIDDEQVAKLGAAVCEALLLGTRRTLVQDIEFAFCQLVEIAVRALSPGVNDPFTAIACIETLGSALAEAARRGPMPRRRIDGQGRVRVFLDVTDFEGFVDTAFNQIRQQGASDPSVMLALLETLGHVTTVVERDAERAVLLRHARLAFAQAAAQAPTDAERDALRQRFHIVKAAAQPESPEL